MPRVPSPHFQKKQKVQLKTDFCKTTTRKLLSNCHLAACHFKECSILRPKFGQLQGRVVGLLFFLLFLEGHISHSVEVLGLEGGLARLVQDERHDQLQREKDEDNFEKPIPIFR